MRSEDNFTSAGKLKKINWAVENTPVHWWNSNPLLTYCGNLYIITTAEIERFTVKVASPLKDEIKDEQLKLEWEQFINEEVAHAYQHTCISKDINRHKYPVTFVTKCVKLFYWIALKIMSTKSKLALVLTLELYAHEFSIMTLSHNCFPMDELAIYDFLRWHAEEELSHSSLCLKVYKYCGGGYVRRAIIFFYFSFWFVFAVMLFLPMLFFVDIFQGRRVKLKHISSAYVYLYGRQGVLSGCFKSFFSFLNPKL